MPKMWDAEKLINEDAIEAMTEEQLASVLAILEKAGY
jgi:hypothetical protein